MNALAEMSLWAERGLWQAALIFFRVGALMALVPGLSEQFVPMRVKMGLAVAITAMIVPAVPPIAPDAVWDFNILIRMVLTEAVNGLLLGVALRLLIFALQTAGAIAAQSSSLSQIAGGAAAEPLPAIGHILVFGAVALAMMMGLHTKLVIYLIASYDVLPAGAFPDPSDVAEWGISGVSRAFAMAFTLAAPFVIVAMIYNFALGVINRAMPQLMVAFVGAPVITFGGLALIFLLAPTILLVWNEALAEVLMDPFGGRP